jgi:protease IV
MDVLKYFVPLILLVSGCGFPSFLITPVSNTNALHEITVKDGRGWFPDKVAIIELEGMLLNARTGGFLQATENKTSLFMQQLERAEYDPSVKAVVLRINSPGGTVTATDIMYEALQRFKKKTHKPVIASTQDMCASGGYYVACGADKIVAHPTSVVGSIGVLFQTLEFEDGLKKLGIRTDAIKSSQLKDMGTPFKHLDPDAREVMQGIVDEYYARFKGIVTTNRPITDPKVLALVTDGRVFSGARSVELGLADQTGRLEDALTLAKRIAKAPGARAVMYKRPYGYSGSIYASTETPTPQATNSLQINLPESMQLEPGFYYLWQP